MNGIQAFLEILHAAGVRYIFGNPGTTELPLNAALHHDQRLEYVFGLHEIPVLTMADGFAMASGKLGVVNLHTACGLGNAMGMLYNAFIERTPLLVTAGQQDRRLRLAEPVLEGDLVRWAQPLTKWSYEVPRVQDLPQAVRRAIQVALTPPRGPVFLSFPLDVQMELAEGLDLSPPTMIDGRIRPPLDSLRQAAACLAEAQNPAILAGSRVTEADACVELVTLAERLGAVIFAEGAPSHGRLPVPANHPLYRGVLPSWSPEIHAQLRGHDVLFVVGAALLRLYIYREPEQPLPTGMRLIHLDSVPWEIGKNYPIDVGVIGDPKMALAELLTLLPNDPARQARAEKRRHQEQMARQQQRETIVAEVRSRWSNQPMEASVLMMALAESLPPEVVVVDEAVTTNQHLFERLGVLGDPPAFFAHRGWALGWGTGVALGVKLAWPQRPVLALIGDGASMYGIQSLWTAAHHQIPVTFLIANNSQYQILKQGGDLLALPELRHPDCPGMNLTSPAIDFVGLARALGVPAQRIEEPESLTAAVRASLQADRLQLIEVPLQRSPER